jgi:hypothetical protein
LPGIGADGIIHTVNVTIYSLLSTIRATKTSSGNNYNNVNPPAVPTAAFLEYMNALTGSNYNFPKTIQNSLLTAPLTQTEIDTIAAMLPPSGVKIDDMMVMFPTNNVALVTPDSNKFKIRIPVAGPWSPITILADGTTVQYNGESNGVKSFIADGPTVESSPKTVNDGDSFKVKIAGIDKIITVSFGSINLNIGNSNSFPTRLNPYIAVNGVLIYKKATVDALVAGTPLPAVPRVAWALNGVNAGSIMRDLKRVAVVADNTGRHLQRWVRIQYVEGSGSEGVDASLADYGCGWICVWDASGIAPVY